MYELSDGAEEILEALWIKKEEKKEKSDISFFKDEQSVKELIENGYLNAKKEWLFTDKGLKEAEKCVRRHRLAEKLLSDVLDVKPNYLHEASCKFEHGLHYGVEDSICTLLGHPKRCPHGKLIPPGDCCKGFEKITHRLVIPLKDLSPQSLAKITYINTEDKETLKKLIGMGILPGSEIKLLHRFPS